MARFVDSFSASKPAALETAVNAALAALTNPTIRGFDLCLLDQPRRINLELRSVLSWTDGGAALATPFLLKTFQDDKLADVETAVQAFLTANPTYFISASRLLCIDPDDKMPIFLSWLIYNTTAGASANFALL